METLIRFDHVARAYGATEVLRDLDFRVEPGEVFALLGRNGSGKTTAVRLALGQLVPDAGACRVLGHEARALPDALWDGLGWVPDRPGFPARWRARELLDFEAATRGSFDLDFARRALRELDLPAERRVGQLSRGQLAQLGLVVAVAQRPRLLILDEPTLGLDVVVRRQFLQALIELVGDQGTGVLLATHLLGDVERVADRVGVLHEGRLVLDARLEDLRGRAQRRRVRLRSRAGLPRLSGLLASREAEGGMELTLSSLDGAEERLLDEAAEALGEPEPLALEELFVALASARGAAFPSLVEHGASA